MPRTAKDYESFDAYVSSILLKRDNREGMFAGWTQESADTEQLIPLLRQYKAQLERENAPEALINQVDRFSKAVYAPKAVSTHKAMKEVLEVFSDFNAFLQSDEGNGVNHYSRLMNLAEENGYDLDQIRSGLLSISNSLELGLELDAKKVYSGPDYERFKVNDNIRDVQQYQEKSKETEAGAWINRPEKQKEYQFIRDYENRREPIPDMPELEENERGSDAPNLKEAGQAPEEIPFLVKNAFYRPAKEWINRFQETQDLYTAPKERPWDREPKMEWLLRIMAVRSLVNAKPGDNKNLKQEISIKDINRRAKELSEVKEVKQFFSAIRKNSAKYDRTIEIAKSGTGAAFETWFRDYVATNGLAPKSPLMDRYLPSAEQRVNIMQQKMRHKCPTLQDQKDCLTQIIASRLAVNAKRGGMFTGMDEQMKNAPKGETYEQCLELANKAVNQMNKTALRRLIKESVDGHGGKMLDTFTNMTGITTQNWKGKINEAPENLIKPQFKAEQPQPQQKAAESQGSVISM